MRKIIFSFLAVVFLTFPLSVMAQMGVKGIPQFLPTTGWTVKPAVTGDARELTNIKLPCMMMVEYDNGYIVRLSGGDYNLMAMAIDFRQEAFVQGRKYQTVISVDGATAGKVEATAFSNNALVINTRPVDRLYQTLQAGKILSMNIEGNQFQFTLGDISQALTRMESCYSGKQVRMSTASLSQPVGVPQPVMPPQAVITPEAAMMPQQPVVSSAPVSINQNRPQTANMPVMATPNRLAPVEMPATQPRRNKPQIWRANQGDSMKATLTRWAEEAGVKIDWQADMSGDLMVDYALATSFEEAVQTLIAQNAAATGIQANLIAGGMNKEIINANDNYVSKPPQKISRQPVSYNPNRVLIGEAPMPRVAVEPVMSAPMAAKPPEMQNKSANWTANQGANLRVALERWSKKEGVELFWQANQSYALRSDVMSNGTYEEALRQILLQFTQDSVRPLAQLNSDPVTGRRILIIQSSNVL